MKAYDFEFDGELLSDKGFMLCRFDSSGSETISNGGQTTFATIPFQRGTRFELTSVNYESCIEATLQICKTTCNNHDMEITLEELSDMARWLSREKFCSFRIMYEDGSFDVWYDAKFDISKVELGGKIYGLELSMQTNSPFAKSKKLLKR